MALALFDLDNTLINGDSDYAWGQFLIVKKLVDEEEYEQKNNYFYEQYVNGSLNIAEYSAFSFQPLTLFSQQELSDLHHEFMQEMILPMVKSKAMGVIENHRELGDTLIMITATNSFITRPIADHFKIQNLIAIEPKIVDGTYTTEIAGVPSFQGGKVIRMQQWLNDNGETLEGSCFYSDSHNDLPLLEKVEVPIAVDPDERLAEIAQQRDWRIISLK